MVGSSYCKSYYQPRKGINLIQNQILSKRIAQLIAQTFAVPLEWVMEESKKVGIEAVIEQLENKNKVSY
jgi:hypothetical protein